MKAIVIMTMLVFSTGIAGNELSSSAITKPSATRETIDYEGRIRAVLEDEGIDDYNIELLVAQSKHESNYYKNNLTKYNNVFARHYSKRDTFATSAGAQAEGHSRFAKYPSVEYATLSQVWYLRKRGYTFKWQSPYQFALELKQKRYYEAPIMTYANALSRAMKRK